MATQPVSRPRSLGCRLADGILVEPHSLETGPAPIFHCTDSGAGDSFQNLLVLWDLTSPAGNDRGPRYTQQVFAALHTHRRPLSLLMAQHEQTAGLLLDVEPSLAAVVGQALHAHHPDCRLQRVGKSAFGVPDGHATHTAELELSPDVFSLRTWASYEEMLQRQAADPISGILNAVAGDPADDVRCHVRLSIVPAGRRVRRRQRRRLATFCTPLLQRHGPLFDLYVWSLRRWWRSPITLVIETLTGRQQPLATAPGFREAIAKGEQHLFACRLSLHVSAPPEKKRQAQERLRKLQGSFAQFTVPGVADFRLRRPWRTARRFILSAEEIAALWHPPVSGVQAERLARSTWREREPPPWIASEGREGSLLGRVAFRGRRDEVRLGLEDRRRHLAIFGQSGTGKSTLLESLITADMQAGYNVAAIDPHGDLIESLLERVPSQRTGDVILFDAADHAHPVGFNPLACSDRGRRPLVVAGIVSALKKLYGDSWGPRLEHILTNTVYALVGQPGATMLSVLRMLADGRYREQIVARIDDPVVRSFWQEEFASWNARFRSEAVSSVQNKIAQLVTNEHLRMITGQAKSTIDIRRAIDHHILLVRLPKGTIGDATSSLLGSLLVTSIQQEAMGRSDTPEQKRPDLMFYCDEFQNFATPSFAVLLSEARKYRVSLCTANQLLSQVPDETLAALFGNCGSLVSFRVGSQDAEAVSEQLTGDVDPADLVALPNYTAYVRLLAEGVPQPAFSLRTLAPMKTKHGGERAEKVRRHSRHRYGRRRDQVEAEVARALA